MGGKLEVKNRPGQLGDEQWSKLLMETSTSAFWNSSNKGIYKISNVTIKSPDINETIPSTKHALSIEGNLVVGNTNTFNKNIDINNGVIITKNNLHIGDFYSSDEKYKPESLLSMYSTLVKPFIIAGKDNKINLSENSLVFGNANIITKTNFIFGNNNNCNGNLNLQIGTDNHIDGTNTDYSYILGKIIILIQNFHS